ncbi:hypothetical protein [Thermomonospora cellulosilytica]|uniref:Uncharacterized protein n=1 Tax=Thermomonospora cellulosilytica TaxID=1411118 RepID=A0A7W3R6F7_9ACTN|nr:hypothetical protein [Thermomonospora cellulosilytica]MBA9001577.1 hypothetical protein [Thermomonospora cellulosilytica]
MTVDIEIKPRYAQATDPTEIELVEDLDALSESAVCSCSAGDDNPF